MSLGIDIGAFEGLPPAPPADSTFTRDDANGTLATSVKFSVDFTEDVTGVDAADFVVVTTGSVTTTPTVVVNNAGDSDASTWQVTVNGVSGIGTVGLAFSPGMNIVNGATPASSTPTVSEVYDIIDDKDGLLAVAGRVPGNVVATSLVEA